MNVQEPIVYGLLGLGVAMVVLACLGVVAMSGVYDRLHYVAPATLGAVLIAAAVWVEEGPSLISLSATLLAGFLLLASPTLAHGTARAALISERGDWRPRRGDAIEIENR